MPKAPKICAAKRPLWETFYEMCFILEGPVDKSTTYHTPKPVPTDSPHPQSNCCGHEFKDPLGKAGILTSFWMFIKFQLSGLPTVMYSNHHVLQREHKTIRKMVKPQRLEFNFRV